MFFIVATFFNFSHKAHHTQTILSSILRECCLKMEICSVSKKLPTLILSKCVQTRSNCPLPAAKNTFDFSGQPGSKNNQTTK